MLVLLDGWMVVRFVGVTRVPLCARVSCVRPVCESRLPPVSFYRYSVCPGSPRCLFTGTVMKPFLLNACARAARHKSRADPLAPYRTRYWVFFYHMISRM